MAKKKALLKRSAARTRRATPRRAAPKTARIEKGTSIEIFSIPDLRAGESWAGVLLNEAGKPVAHLIDIAHRNQEGTWQEQIEWAKSVGGELPNKQEGALLYANRGHSFEKRWHWLREEYAGYAGYAWLQLFGNGSQLNDRKGNRCLACAVRRVAI